MNRDTTVAAAAGFAALDIEAEAVRRLRSLVRDSLPAAVDLLATTTGRVIVSGIGKSGLVGAKIAATLASTGTPAIFVHSTEALHGDSGMVVPGDTAILISNSGRTAEVVQFGRMLRRRGVPVIAVAAPADSPLAQMATVHLSIEVEREADPLNLAPTASTTVTIALGDALAAALMAMRGTTPAQFHQFHPGGSLGEDLETETA